MPEAVLDSYYHEIVTAVLRAGLGCPILQKKKQTKVIKLMCVDSNPGADPWTLPRQNLFPCLSLHSENWAPCQMKVLNTLAWCCMAVPGTAAWVGLLG